MTVPTGATLDVLDISKSFRRDGARENDVIRAMNLTAAPGSLTLVEGIVGSGRSTVLRCLYRTYRVDTGSVILSTDSGSVDLTDATDRTVAWLRERHFSFFDGQFHAPPHFSVWRALARSSSVDEEHARECLENFEIGELGDVPVGRLLPAEARLLALAMSLSRRTSFYLLDEPLLGQGEPVQRHTLSAVEAARARGAAVIVTADPGSVWAPYATSKIPLNKKVKVT